MATFTPIVSLHQQIHTALEQVRKYRHQPDCHCRLYRGYCSREDESWSSILDRLLDRVPRHV